MKLFNSRMMTLLAVPCMVAMALLVGTAAGQDSAVGSSYSFVYLGDLHFDRMSHHDLDWVKTTMPNDLRQIEGYVRNTEEYTPDLLRRVQMCVAASDGRIKMVLQGGDLTEGLCGRRELQEAQFQDARRFVYHFLPTIPFLAAKGNHDITGPGAREAYDRVMLPWLSEECDRPVKSASFSLRRGPDLFIFFDAYHDNSLDWLEKTLREHSHRYVFMVMHPPAVPYGARSTWHLFSRARDEAVRTRFLEILGANRVVLLTAHLHKYSVLTRRTTTGAFVQLSLSSVISSPAVTVKDHLQGVQNYDSSLADIEPEFQPQTRTERQESLEREKPYITRFEYADFPGYAIVRVSDERVSADLYLGASDNLWKTVSLVPMFDR